jgi:hypothetical protein
MIRLQAAALSIVTACLGIAWPAAAAGKYDGSVAHDLRRHGHVRVHGRRQV